MKFAGVIKSLWAVILVLGLSSVSGAQAQVRSCTEILSQAKVASTSSRTVANDSRRIYPAGVDPVQNPNDHIMFGFEAEYALGESASLLTFYGPAARFGISKERWLYRMSTEDRVAWVKSHWSKADNAIDTDLVKWNRSSQYSFLPEKLVLDSTGNLEIILKPVHTLNEWYQQMQLVNRTFGAGSMQTMISVPSELFFAKNQPALREQKFRQNLGLFNFFHDYDTLEKLLVGATRYAKDPTKEVARSFDHPWLGPMNAFKRDHMIRYMKANAEGKNYDMDSVEFIRYEADSFKYIGSTSYRPDVAYPKRVSMEVRDAHQNQELLESRVLRAVNLLTQGYSEFEAAHNFAAFDSVADYNKLSQSVRQTLEKIFPPREPMTKPSEELVLSLFRNYAYPLKDWSNHIFFLKDRALVESVSRAQVAYVEKLKVIDQRFRAGELDLNLARASVQGALAQFAAESGLAQAMKTWYEKQFATEIEKLRGDQGFLEAS